MKANKYESFTKEVIAGALSQLYVLWKDGVKVKYDQEIYEMLMRDARAEWEAYCANEFDLWAKKQWKVEVEDHTDFFLPENSEEEVIEIIVEDEKPCAKAWDFSDSGTKQWAQARDRFYATKEAKIEGWRQKWYARRNSSSGGIRGAKFRLKYRELYDAAIENGFVQFLQALVDTAQAEATRKKVDKEEIEWL